MQQKLFQIVSKVSNSTFLGKERLKTIEKERAKVKDKTEKEESCKQAPLSIL
jgi:hypothetical protein